LILGMADENARVFEASAVRGTSTVASRQPAGEPGAV
jgi:hypothetical protein